MKRLILLMCAGLLVACEPDSAYRERIEAREKFAEAQIMLDRAMAGTIGHDVGQQPYEKPIYEYRREQFDAAANVLRPLADSSNESDRIAARTLLAENAITHGSAVVQDASDNWTRLLGNHSRLLSAVTGLRDAYAVQAEYEAIDYSGQIAELEDEQQQLLGERQEVEQRVAAINDRLAELQAQADEAQAQRRELDQRADELSRQAFSAEGQEQYDLYVQASDLSDEAGLLASEVETVQGQIDVEQSQLSVEQIYIDQIDAQIEQLREAAEALETRAQSIADLAQEAGESYQEYVGQFERVLDEIIAGHEEQVENVIADAYDYFAEAEQQLQGASQAASGQARDAIRVQVESARAGHGRAHAEIAKIRQAYRNLLISVAEAVSDVLPDHASSMSDLASELGERADEAAAEAEQRLDEAREQLAEMVEPAEARGNTGLHRAVLQHLIVVNNALARLTNDAGYSDDAADYRNQLNEL